jgi:PilZ domain
MSEIQQPIADSEPTVDPQSEFFTKSGPLPTAWQEVRRFPRFYFRARVPAVIHPMSGGQGGEAVKCCLLARDLSRGGINLLHSVQLFPGQRIDIALNDAASRSVEVVWCRRLANNCYAIGCRFFKAESDAATQAVAAATPVTEVPPSADVAS